MATVPSFCAHCMGTSNLRVIGVAAFPLGPKRGLEGIEVALGTACTGCHNPVAVLARRTHRTGGDNANMRQAFSHLVGNLINLAGTIEDHGLEVVDFWPQHVEPIQDEARGIDIGLATVKSLFDIARRKIVVKKDDSP